MHRWFHPNITNVEAETLLRERGVEGSFLVRPSKSSSGQFSLSIKTKDEVKHVKIRQIGDFYDLHGGEQFTTLANLIQHYIENPVKDFELITPLRAIAPTKERWFHGSISGVEADKLIREKGVTGSFLVRESQSQLGGYVLTVRAKDEKSNSDQVAQVMIRYQNNKYDIGGLQQFDSLTDLVEYYKRNPMVETTGLVVNMKYPFNSTRITASEIDSRVAELSKENQDGEDGFLEEWEHLQNTDCKVLFNRKIGQNERNMMKNRHKNILPFDYTRVILKRPIESEKDTDYINADYIKLVEDGTTISPKSKPLHNSKIYIATQGPLPSTVNDFWWMVWQEESDCIVMVTREIERDKNKCHRYWPTIDNKLIKCGPLELKSLHESHSKNDDYIHREFELKHKFNGEKRVIHHYQYTAWPDQNIPSNPKSVLTFLQDINHRRHSSPMIVHCSAGIGRSGTLIVIDMLMDQLRYHGLVYEIDVQHIVEVARSQRFGLVQTVGQYKFIYQAIQKYISQMRQWKSGGLKL